MSFNLVVLPRVCKFIAIIAALLFMTGGSRPADAYDLKKYSYMPPFIDTARQPAVLLVCDTSGSMDALAYAEDDSDGAAANTPFDPNRVYDGYFDSYAYYRYVRCRDNEDTIARSGFFQENPAGWVDTKGDRHGYHSRQGGDYPGFEDGEDNVGTGDTGTGYYEWSGNLLNYITMRRMDVLKKVLIGGRRAPANLGTLFDQAPTGFDTGSAVDPLEYLVIGDEQWQSRTVTFSDVKTALPPGPSETESEAVAAGKPATAYYLTPYGTGGGGVAVEFDQQVHATLGTDGLRGYYLHFTAVTEALSQRKLLVLKLPTDAGQTEQPQGVIQQVGNQLRLGVMRYNADNQGGKVDVPVGNTDHLQFPISTACPAVPADATKDLGDGFRLDGAILAVNNLSSNGESPVGEALATAVDYFRQSNTALNTYHADDYLIDDKFWDPFFINRDTDDNCVVAPDEGDYGVCSQGHVILLTDGESSGDDQWPGWAVDYSDGGNAAGLSVDDIARYAHITDLRTNDDEATFSAQKNVITVYPLYLFGAGSDLLKSTARNGGFIDKNNDGRPNTIDEEASRPAAGKEWDFDADGEPDNYFEAANGTTIHHHLVSALSSVMNKAAAGSAAAVMTGSKAGAGAVFQALFFPEMIEPAGVRSVAWSGYLHALFIDRYGNIWEDTNQNAQLDGASPDPLTGTSDRIVVFYRDEVQNQTKVRYYTGRISSGRDAGAPDPATVHPDSYDPERNNLSNVKPIWEAGKGLSQIEDAQLTGQRGYTAAAAGRYLFTWIDTDNDGQVDELDEIKDFVQSETQIYPYLDLPNPTDPDYISPANLIDWIRGIDQTGLRRRAIDFYNTGTPRTWRLGDIVYSTPTVVGPPAEALDLIYGDTSYRSFYNVWRNRRQVVYVGGNDGMLHAFNAGFYDQTDQKYTVTGNSGETAYALGQELWAFIPFDLLPHLQALPQPDYHPRFGHHVSFVDLKPKAVDVQFNDGTWHTVLLCGMRFGGGKVTVNGDALQSAFFALDVTNPEQPPRLLWSFNDTHNSDSGGTGRLGFTTAYPAVMTVHSTDAKKNYVVVGSGPTTLNELYASHYPRKSDQAAHLFAIDIETGDVTRITTLAEGNAYFGDAVAVDINFRAETVAGKRLYSTELGYVGMAYHEGGLSKGKLMRIRAVTESGDSRFLPDDWEVDVLSDVERPVVAAPNVSIAGLKGRLGLYQARIQSDDETTVGYVPMVYAGTGEYFFKEDANDTAPNYFYGIKEPVTIESVSESEPATYKLTFATVDPSSLMDTTATKVYTNGWVDVEGNGADPWRTEPETPSFTSWSSNPPDFKSWLQYLMVSDVDEPANDHFYRYAGWKTGLAATGERAMGQAGLLGGLVAFATYTPSTQICEPIGTSNLYALHYLTGSAYYLPILGFSDDTITIDTDGDGETDITFQGSKNKTDLGTGLAATPSLHPGSGAPRVYIQTSSGEIRQIDLTAPLKVLGPGVHLRFWHD